ncbi:ribbon-helix-helix domain-containing protein [Novosphingobium huizhouense]|uniref:ribbon-helix-helix domain-containing protein n=1 Tax=Novosphingobium huizhouense TaxID=2866625 RepID=UPI001CD8D78D|nr:type II toxin-antitoxin system ParD family antitoxin [Novosphingobium huizhouense]
MGKIDQLSVDIPADFRELAEGAVAGGEFSSLEHVVDAALRAWAAKREADMEKLRALIDEGIDSGFEPWEGIEAIIAEGRRKLAERQK